MKDKKSSAKIGEVLRVLEDIQNAGVIEKYAIGGAIAAILHYEPISTIDLDILERHDLQSKWNKEKWRFINEG